MSGFVVDELVGEEAEDANGVSFPEGFESLFFRHGGNAVAHGGIILFDFACVEEFVCGLQSQFDDFDGVGGSKD